MHRAGAERRRAPRGEAQGLGRVPLSARRARGRPAAARDREGQVPGADGAVHVDSHGARRVGAADRPAPRRPAHRAGALHAVGDASSMREGVRTFVEVGPGNVLSGLVKRIDRSVHTVSINNLESLDAAARAASLAGVTFAVARRQARPRHRRVEGDRPRDRRGARARRRRGRRRLPHRRRGGGGARERDRRPRDPGRRLERRGRGAARRGGGRPRHPRQQRRPHPRRPPRAHARRRLAHRDRDEPLVRLLHVPRRDAADDEEARRRDRQRLVDRRRARQLGPDELRRVEGRDHRFHEVARARARQPQRPRERRRAGYVKTQLTDVLPEEATAAMLTNTPLGRLGEPGDVAGQYASSAPTTQRSSQGMCCSSTADSGCSERKRLL